MWVHFEVNLWNVQFCILFSSFKWWILSFVDHMSPLIIFTSNWTSFNYILAPIISLTSVFFVIFLIFQRWIFMAFCYCSTHNKSNGKQDPCDFQLYVDHFVVGIFQFLFEKLFELLVTRQRHHIFTECVYLSR